MTKKRTKKDPEILRKAEDEEKEMDDEEETQDEGEDDGSDNDEELKKMKKDKAEKSEDLIQEDLQKSLDKLAELAADSDETTRKNALLQKALTEDLSESESGELFKLMGHEETEDSTVGEDIVKSFEENETLQKALDVSDYLQSQNDELVKAITTLADTLEQSDGRQHEVNLVLIKALVDVGTVVKDLNEKMEKALGQPARGPKSAGVTAQPMEKSFAGASPEVNLSKSEILDAMDDMFQKSMDTGKGGLVNGVNMQLASTRYETTNEIAPTTLQMVQRHIQSSATQH